MSGMGGVRRTDEVWVPVWICRYGHVTLRRAGEVMISCDCSATVSPAQVPEDVWAERGVC